MAKQIRNKNKSSQGEQELRWRNDGRANNGGRGNKLGHVQILLRLPASMRTAIEAWGKRRDILSAPQAAIAMIGEILENERMPK